MSRSGYSEDLDDWDLIRWRGQVASAIRGKRGQTFLSDLMKALDELPEKLLIAGELQDGEGDVCAIGALGKARGLDMSNLDPEDYDAVATVFGIAHQLAQEVVYTNDEDGQYGETPQQRYARMRKWVASLLKEEWRQAQEERDA